MAAESRDEQARQTSEEQLAEAYQLGRLGTGFETEKQKRKKEIEANPERTRRQIRRETRVEQARREFLYWKLGISPNPYQVEYGVVPMLFGLSDEILFLDPYSPEELLRTKEGETTQEKPLPFKVCEELRDLAEEVRARSALLVKAAEQLQFATDIDVYLRDYFQYQRKAVMDSDFIGIIFRMKGTIERENGETTSPLGEKIETALSLWKEVAEGKAVVEFPVRNKDGKIIATRKRTLPNHWALPQYTGLEELVIRSYIVPGIRRKHESNFHKGIVARAVQAKIDISDPEAIQKGLNLSRKEMSDFLLEEEDNITAALLADILIDHWDLDMEWGMAERGYKPSLHLSAEDEQRISLELAEKDSGKAAWFWLRRRLEWTGKAARGEKRRQHPRIIGAPATIDAYPRLTADFLRITSVEVRAEVNDLEKHVDAAIFEANKEMDGPVKKKDEDEKEWSKKQRKWQEEEEEFKAAGLKADEKFLIRFVRRFNERFSKVGYHIPEIDIESARETLEAIAAIATTEKEGSRKQLIEFVRGAGELIVCIGDAVWGQRIEGQGEVTRLVKVGENFVPTKFRFEPKTFKEIDWDDIRVWDFAGMVNPKDIKPAEVGGDPKGARLMDKTEGVRTNAFEVPYKLQGFYALTALFSNIMRTDYEQLYIEIIKDQTFLMKMNKGIDLALGLMQYGFNLDRDTLDKLNAYIRVVFMGGLAASLIKVGLEGVPSGYQLEHQNQLLYGTARQKDEVKRALKEAATKARFLTVKEMPLSKDPNSKEGWRNYIEPKEEALFDLIVEKRRAPTPFELNSLEQIGEWFTDQQLKMLSPLYPPAQNNQ